MSLVQKYRPQHFEDIVGQTEAVKLLSQAALRGGALENVLLYGPRGLGKTSLVPIYAMAVNCCNPSPMGSPCRSQACKGCDSFQDHYRYYSVPKNPGLEAVQYWVEAQINSTWSGIKRTLFFDEAHMLSNGAMAYLLQVMEDRRPNISFCFATTELGRLTTAFISRCLKIQLEPLSLEESLVLLRRTAESERYSVEHDALVLLARYKRGYARDLLQGLNQVALYGDKVDVENVRAVFDLDQDKDVVDYLLAAIKSDEHLLVSIKQRWRSSAADKIVLIRALLTSLYYRNVCNLDIAISLFHLSYLMQNVDHRLLPVMQGAAIVIPWLRILRRERGGVWVASSEIYEASIVPHANSGCRFSVSRLE
jgi:DNA polymerase III subunit gamma/tau